MSPNIALRSVVDRFSSPAFRAMDLLREYQAGLHITAQERFTELVVHRIIRLYESRRSSPRDTDITGKSILHHWAHVSYSSCCRGY